MDRLQTLAIFQRVCEAHSFTSAAASLNLPRSTVTQAVQRLEQQLGVPLLLRTTRQVSVTAEGEVILEKARHLLSDWEELSTLFSQDTQPMGIIRVNMPSRFARLLVIPQLPEFHQRFPGIELNIGVSDIRVDMIEQGVDLLIRAGTLQDSGLIARPLPALSNITLASPDYLARFGTPESLEALQGHEMVGYVLPSSGRVEALEFRDNDGYRELVLPHPVTTNSTDAYIAAGLAGLGLVQVPVYGIIDDLKHGRLIEVLSQHPPASLPVSMLYPARRRSSRHLRVFMDWLSDVVARQIQASEAG
ncbi:LysR family transcriptional regulator [Gynuella sunshinyii]|uniref:Transcriptional regulator n=1 Tax=Gynuella sunshinyii YC6258 TaxID=1445510 RepID=A0A0C5VHP6_9GAMM|nr:LysR family transcriptional regulator [Gynuella sunshinyii]AJQ92878.1 transcriptional regulator [Gynuella sunshinyii YC6258]